MASNFSANIIVKSSKLQTDAIANALTTDWAQTCEYDALTLASDIISREKKARSNRVAAFQWIRLNWIIKLVGILTAYDVPNGICNFFIGININASGCNKTQWAQQIKREQERETGGIRINSIGYINSILLEIMCIFIDDIDPNRNLVNSLPLSPTLTCTDRVYGKNRYLNYILKY